MTDSWSITENEFRPALNRAYEGLFTQGSGYLHVRGSLEEHLSGAPQNEDYTRRPANVTAEKFQETKARWGTFIPGVRGMHPLLNRSLANLPYFLDLAPFVEGEKLDMEASKIEGYVRRLDLKTGLLNRSFRWFTRSGSVLDVSYERFISADLPQLCLQQLRISSDRDVIVTVRAGIDAGVRTSGYDMFEQVDLQPEDANGVSCHLNTNTGDQVWLLSRLYPAGAGWQYFRSDRLARLSAELSIPAGSSMIVEKRTAVSSSFDRTWRDPSILLTQVAEKPYLALLADHNRVWTARWEKADVVIEGDERSQLAIRLSLYHLFRAHPNDNRLSIDPKGYAGDAYRGCYFWDTEIYMLPFYLYTDPARARSLLEYRVNSLPGARINARQSGYTGARFAWEADIDGSETCPNWQYRDHEIHVSADIVYALDHYARATHDYKFLLDQAAPVILETARFWIDRLDWRLGEDHPSLLGVMGPDEYTPLSNNNSFTNRMVAHTLSLAARLSEVEAWSEVEAVNKDGASIGDKGRQFSQAAAGLTLPRSPDGYLVLQSEDFARLAEPAFERFWSDRSRPLAAQIPQEWLYRSKCLKQADVLLLMMLFPAEFSEEEVQTAWDYYLPYTTHDSSLSPGVHAIVASRLGKTQEAWEFWERCSRLDLEVEAGGAAEGVHMANAGLNWQIAIFGFAGLSTAMEAEVPTFRPRLPERWSSMEFPLQWKGSQLRVKIEPAQVYIENLGSTEQDITVYGYTKSLTPGLGAVFPFPSKGGESA